MDHKKTPDGYACSVCQEFGIKGLHEKGKSKRGLGSPHRCHSAKVENSPIRHPKKHADSAAHQAAVAASHWAIKTTG